MANTVQGSGNILEKYFRVCQIFSDIIYVRFSQLFPQPLKWNNILESENKLLCTFEARLNISSRGANPPVTNFIRQLVSTESFCFLGFFFVLGGGGGGRWGWESWKSKRNTCNVIMWHRYIYVDSLGKSLKKDQQKYINISSISGE